VVDDKERLNFLPTYLGTLMVRGEHLVYHWMRHLSDDYDGGLWNFYELSNGGFYLVPDGPEWMHVEVHSNGFSGGVSSDAAGIISTLFMLGQLASENEGTDVGESLIRHYDSLRAFADGHAEACSIFRAID
jgi:hypothetical protein